MAKFEIMNTVTRQLHRVGFKLKKHSPEILVGLGVVGTVASTVMACKATAKLDEVLEDPKKKIDKIHELMENPEKIPEGKEYTEEDGKKDLTIMYTQSAVKIINHSGMSIGFTKNILNRLIDGKCLTPIEDAGDIWKYSFDRGDGIKTYQCKRMSSFFKDVYPDGRVKYNDIDRVIKVDMTTDTTWHSGFIDRIVDDLYPITMPYMPTDKPYKVYCEDFLTDLKNGDYDTVGVLYGIDPSGDRFEINRYFKDGDQHMIEIDKEEYEARKLMDMKRKVALKGE